MANIGWEIPLPLLLSGYLVFVGDGLWAFSTDIVLRESRKGQLYLVCERV